LRNPGKRQRVILRRPRADKELRHHVGRDVFDARRVPARGVVLVDGQGADALDGLAVRAFAQVKAVVHQIALHAQLVGQVHVTRTAHLLQRHVQHKRRAGAQLGRGVARPVAVDGLQRGDDVAHGR